MTQIAFGVSTMVAGGAQEVSTADEWTVESAACKKHRWMRSACSISSLARCQIQSSRVAIYSQVTFFCAIPSKLGTLNPIVKKARLLDVEENRD